MTDGKFLMSHHTIALLFGFLLSAPGCGSAQVALQERPLSERNPTNYEFNASVKDVQAAIKRDFSYQWLEELRLKNKNPAPTGPLYTALQMQGASLLWRGEGDSLSKKLLRQPGNEEDAYLYGGGSCVGLSQVYFKDGQPLVYFADFHIHLAVVSSARTRVTVLTYGPSVVAGLERRVAHGPAYVFVEVPPTSVEEYQILLRIGHELAIRNMPQIKLPGPETPMRNLSRPK